MLDFLGALGQNEWVVKTIAPVFLLGFLIFVHESGHFLFAKMFGVGVEKFSFGFGPRIFGFTHNGTEYRLSWIPLGGYVKMVGDDPFEEAPTDWQYETFLHKPVWQRLLIALAGPLFNLLLPIVLFAGLYMAGSPKPTTWIGLVLPDSPAEVAGLQTGDRVIAVGETRVATFDELRNAIANVAPGGRASLSIERDGVERKVSVQLRMDETVNQWGEPVRQNMLGVAPTGAQSLLGVLKVDGSPANDAGLRTGDRVRAVDGESVKWWYQVERHLAAATGPVSLEIERADEHLMVSLEAGEFQVDRGAIQQGPLTSRQLQKAFSTAPFGIFPFELFVEEVMDGKPASVAGLSPGDMLFAINGTPVTRWLDVKRLIESPAEELKVIQLLRGGNLLELSMQPEVVSRRIPIGGETKEGQIGIRQGEVFAMDQMTVRYSPWDALVRGTLETAGVTYASARILMRIVTGDIPLTESLGGPIAIVTVAAQSAWRSVYQYVRVMALISVSLGIMNLLPIPLLDGGQILFFTLEWVRGRPVSMRFREVSQQVGLILLFILMAFAVANDVRNSFLR